MRSLSAGYLAAAKAAGRYPNIRAVVSGQTMTGNGAIRECHIMKGDSAKPAYFETCLALSSECRITVDRRRVNDESALVSGAKIIVYSAFDDPTGSTIASEKLGTFYITSYDKSDAVNGIITASDFMLYTGVDFNPEGLTYPIAISDLFAEAWKQSGMPGVATNFDIDPNVKSAIYQSDTPKASGMQGNPYLCRDVLARIAAMNLGALYIDADEVPQIYKYQQASIADSNILEIRIGSETYYIRQILAFKSEERMAKKKAGYEQLPYAPRFDNMDDIGTGSQWLDEITAASTKIRNKPWTTATVTIQGVGEIEPGDFVTAAGTTLLVTGISYDFVNAHFTETLYSYAFTEEEYYMAPQKTVNVSAGTEKKGGVGENVGQHNERFNGYTAADGCTITGGDYNHAEGYKNTLQGCNKTHVTGGENTAQGVTGGIIGGENNTVTGSTYCVVGGYGNTLTPLGSTGGGILVSMTSAVRGFFNSVFGQNHDIVGDTNNISGVHNVIRGHQNNVSGTGNTVTGNSNVVGGAGNTVTASSTCVVGDQHNVTQSDCLVCGSDADTSTLSSGASVCLLVGGGGNGNVFYVRATGDAYGRSFNLTGADYAELFEWLDGNADNEDRRGYLVSLDGDKIIPAHGDDIFGIISANPSIIGNNPLEWHGKYKKDVFGSPILDENGEMILSDEYDPEKQYIPRDQRPEWSPLGLVGRLIIVDNGSCKPNGYVSARNGIGTASLSPTNIRVLRRVDDKHVEVLSSRG